MSDTRIRSIVILGGGTAGWMTAAALAKINTPRQFDLTLVESDEIGTVGVGEATIPTIHWFNQLVGFDEAALLRETGATFKLGIEFPGWNGEGRSYFHPFGRYGGPRDGSMFYHRWIRQRLEGRLDDQESFSLAAGLARAGRFMRPVADPNALASTLGYAYHFDASLYARFLRRQAEARGVRRVEGKVLEVLRDSDTGFVSALRTDRGECLQGDFFIDCSGFRGLLIEGALEAGFEDWSGWLPCDRAMAVPTANVEPPAPFTRATARSAGWQWRIPLQHRTGNGLVYSSAHLDDEAARALLVSNLESEALAEPRPLRFRAGLRKAPWSKNVLAIGLSSGFLEPLESTSIHFIQSAIAKFLSLFPSRSCPPVTAEQFNRTFRADMESARDILILHYRATEGREEPFWQEVRAQTPPDSLRFRIESFVRTGRIVLGPEELFKEASWFSVLIGQGITPNDYNPLVEVFDGAQELRTLHATRKAIAAQVARAESLATVLDRTMGHGAMPA
jgi:tryptophan 7-halogenase